MLITFNILTYDKIIQFEQTLVTQIRAQNTSQRQNSARRFREGSRSTISEYHHSGRGRGSNAASHNSAQNHNTVGKICILSFDKLAESFYYVRPLWIVNYYVINSSNNLSNGNINTGVFFRQQKILQESWVIFLGLPLFTIWHNSVKVRSSV